MNVNVNLVIPGNDGGNPEYVLNADNWNGICFENDLLYGDIIVFTKVGNNILNLMGFNPFGRAKTLVNFLGATDINLVQPELDHEEKSKLRLNVQC